VTKAVLDGSLASQFCSIYGPQNKGKTIIVWGDSMSSAWMPPFLKLVREEGVRVIQFSHAACPPLIGVHRTGESFAKNWCNDSVLQGEIFKAIKLLKPDYVFLISRWNLYYHGHIKDDILVEKSFITNEFEEASIESAKKSFAEGLSNTLGGLSQVSRVIIFKDTPVLKVPIEVGRRNRLNNFEPSTQDQSSFEEPINRLIDNTVSKNPSSMSFNPVNKLCNAEKCFSFKNGVPLYSDEAHPTAFAALLFFSDIKSIVEMKK
jgi:hypothetical protein